MVKFNMLYSIYSLPNIFIPLFGGFLTDSFGAGRVLLYSSLLITIGQVIFALSPHFGSFYLALIGRAIFGSGGENLDLAQSVIVLSWFSGKELSMAFGLNSSISLLGSVLNDNTEPFIVSYTGSLSFGLWVGVFVCLLSFFSVFWLNSINNKRLESLPNRREDLEGEKFSLKDLGKLDWYFWLLLINSCAIDSSIFCFCNIASGYYQDRFGYDMVESGSIMSIAFFTAAFLNPFVGIVVDTIGKRALFLIVSSVFVACFHLLLLMTPSGYKPIAPVLYFVVLGIGYSVYVTVFWAALSYTVDHKIIGTAYGIMYSFGNLALVVFPIIVGVIQESFDMETGYFGVGIFLECLAVIGIITCIVMYSEDIKKGGILDTPNPCLVSSKIDKTVEEEI
jgi:MFS family permease